MESVADRRLGDLCAAARGPYPATTAPSTTSVGTDAIGRFLRPVAYQGFPEHLLPAELRDTPPADDAVLRRVDGHLPG